MINVRDSVNNDGGCMGCSSRENVKVIMLGNFQARICSNCLLDIIEQAHLTKRAGGRGVAHGIGESCSSESSNKVLTAQSKMLCYNIEAGLE